MVVSKNLKHGVKARRIVNHSSFLQLQQVTFRADKQVRKTNHVLKGVAMGDVGPNEECKWEDELKNIPPVPPTKLGGSCKNIEVKYLLSVSNIIIYINIKSVIVQFCYVVTDFKVLIISSTCLNLK